MRGSLPFFLFSKKFFFLTLFLFIFFSFSIFCFFPFFFVVFFLFLFHIFFIFPFRTLPKTSLFPTRNINFKARFWVREEETKKKEKKRSKQNAPTETGPYPQTHAQDLFVIRVRENPSLRSSTLKTHFVRSVS